MKQLLLPILISLLAFSCDLVVDVDVPFEGKQVTANAFFNPDSVWSVQLSMNRFILDEAPFDLVEDAAVIIYENETAIATLAHVGNGLFRSDDLTPAADKTYKLTVKVPGYPELRAGSAIPSPTPITSVEAYEAVSNSQIKVRIRDDGLVANFYEIQVTMNYEMYDYAEDRIEVYPSRLQISTDDPLIQHDDAEEYRESIVFKDVLFNGKEPEFNFDLPGGGLSRRGVTVILKTLSEDGYNYLRTLSLSNMTSGDPFAQPVNVYNNVSNGFGIFAGYSASAYTSGSPRPVITSIDPPAGKPGDRIVITGEHFTPEQNVFVWIQSEHLGYSVQTVSISPTRIEFIIPPNAHTGRLLVSNGKLAVWNEDFIVR